jgi:quinol monooxygenase YgiN
MSRVARYGRMTAKPGRGEELARLMLAAAAEQAGDPGCLLYLVNRAKGDAEVLWVTELWRSQTDLDASIERIRGSDDVTAVMALVEEFEAIELDELGGKGPG